MMETHVAKWGNSLALRIPVEFARKLSLHNGDITEMQIENDHLIITKKDPEPTLNSLLAKITGDNIHYEISSNYSLGKENIDE
jgi:antitoxin MazE